MRKPTPIHPFLALWTIACVAVTIVRAQEPERRPATPLDPVAAILDAFESHDLVALGEGPHNNERSHAFRLGLIRDPRCPSIVNDIVVESGSAWVHEPPIGN